MKNSLRLSSQVLGRIINVKTLLVVKLTAILITLACIQVSAKTTAQNISISQKNTTLQKVFKEIHKKTGYQFFYQEELLQKARKFDIDVKNVSIEQALSICFKDQPLDFTITENTITITKKDNPVYSNAPLTPLAPIKISGKVTNQKGAPLAAATVLEKGTNNATTTQEDGSFTMNVEHPESHLIISYIGYSPKEIVVGNQTNFTVVMQEVSNDLGDIIVIGYGTQKKVDLTGSVANVNSEEINKRTSPNAATLLQGKIAGLEVVQPTGIPGGDAPQLQIRGLGSFGASSSPLVLIDGVIGDLNTISAYDIDNISVLKDAASASIYGNRAANGVVLVTTKRGKPGALSITYSNNLSINRATRLPDLVYNSAEYMEMYNNASLHSGNSAVYTQQQIDLYKNAAPGSQQYPNYNWIKNYIKDAGLQDHHLTVSGGNGNTNFNLSLGYLTQNGVVKDHGYDRYNMLFNIDSRINKIFKFGSTIAFNKSTTIAPGFAGPNVILDLYANSPTYGPFLPDGSGRLASNDFIGSGAFHIFSVESIFQGTHTRTDNYETRTQAYLEATILKGLTWMVKGAFNYNDQFINNQGNTLPEYYYQPDASGIYQFRQNSSVNVLGVSNQDNRSLYLNAYTTLNYKKTFAAEHHINILAGYSEEQFTNQSLGGSRNSFPSTILTQLNAGSVTGQTLNGDSYQYALRSLFGRVNYDYKEKYLLEFNGRYDGSSRIAPNKRYGLFPSVSAGWRLSQEDFIHKISWIDNLKVRGSYGKLGNQEIGNYPYQDILNVVNYSFGNQNTAQGAQVQSLTDKDLQWETTNITDVGLDMTFMGGLFSATVDWYNKKTNGILTQPTILYAVGLNAPITNFGTLQNRGLEINLGHTHSISKYFKYAVNAILTVNRNKLLKIAATQDKGTNIDMIGQPYDSYYLTKWIGIFQSQDDIDKSPLHPYNPKPGDLKFQDYNNDGKIDANDRQIFKGLYADYTYSFSLNLSYKSFDFSTFFQGVKGIKRYVNAWGVEPFLFGGAPPTSFRNAWTPENHSETIPALYVDSYLPVDGTSSTYFLKDASYLRVKNIQLTYHLPEQILHKLPIKTASIHLSADNLFTFTKFVGDPERDPASTLYASYPQVKVFSAGLNVQF